MTTKEVANKLVNYCREGKNVEAINELYAENVVSHEPQQEGDEYWQRIKGKDKVHQKTKEFMESVAEIHSSKISEPAIADGHFSCSMDMDITFKDERGRSKISEICVYEVKDGKITNESFFYPTWR